MKKLAMILAVAFTMGLAASTVSASSANEGAKKDKKAKTECCAKAKECTSKEKKSCCAAANTAETPAKPVKPAK